MQQPSPLLSLVPLLIITVPIIFMCYHLSKEKGKNVTLWTILGIIPFVNYFALIYLVGAANVRLERKIDEILSLLKNQQ